jgi:hypothetical protein
VSFFNEASRHPRWTNCPPPSQPPRPAAPTAVFDRLPLERAYCHQAVCSPSRNALPTSLRPQALGIYDLPTNFPQVASLRSVAGSVPVAPRFAVQGTELRAGRKPLRKLVLLGALLPRLEQRTSDALLSQWPPRPTRSVPDAGPRGSVVPLLVEP